MRYSFTTNLWRDKALVGALNGFTFTHWISAAMGFATSCLFFLPPIGFTDINFNLIPRRSHYVCCGPTPCALHNSSMLANTIDKRAAFSIRSRRSTS